MAVADTDVNIFDDTENSGNNGGGGGGGITEIESETLEVSKSGNKAYVDVDIYSSDGSVDVQLDTSSPDHPYWDLKVDIPPTPDLVTEEEDGLARALDKEIHDHSYANVAHRTISEAADDANRNLSNQDSQYSPQYGQIEQWLDTKMKFRTHRYETIPSWNLPISAAWDSAVFDKKHGTFVVLDKAADSIAYGQLWVAVRTLGTSWEVKKPGLASENWRCIACSDVGVIIALSGNSSSEIAISTDGGYEWKLSTLPSAQYWTTVKSKGEFFYFTSWDHVLAAVMNIDGSGISYTEKINRISGESMVYDSYFENFTYSFGNIAYTMYRISSFSGDRRIVYATNGSTSVCCTFTEVAYDRISNRIHRNGSILINNAPYDSFLVAYSSFINGAKVGVCGSHDNPSQFYVLSETDYSIDGNSTMGIDLFIYGDYSNVNGYYYVCYDTVTNITHIYDRSATLFGDPSEKGEDHQFEGKFMNAMMIEGNILLFDGSRYGVDEHKGSNAILVNVRTWEIVDVNNYWREVFLLDTGKRGLLYSDGGGFEGVGTEEDYMKIEDVEDDYTQHVLKTVHSDRITEYANYPLYQVGSQTYDRVYCNVSIPNMINGETLVYSDEECTVNVGVVMDHSYNLHNPNNVLVRIDNRNEVYDFSSDKTPKALATTKAILDLKQEVDNMANFGIQSKSVSVSQNGVTTISADSGKLMNEVSVDVNVPSFSFGTKVYKSTDGGTSWTQQTNITWNSSLYRFEINVSNQPNDIVCVTADGNPPAADYTNVVLFYTCMYLSAGGSFTTVVGCAFTDGTNYAPIWLTV